MDEIQKSKLLKIWAIVGPVVGFLVATIFSYRQTIVSEKTYDRASGRIVAELRVVKILPDDRDIPPPYRAKDEPFCDQVYFDDLDRLLALNPTVVVENTGIEPIDALKLEIRETDSIIDSRGLPRELIEAKTPWVTRQSEVTEYVLNEKLIQGAKASIPLVQGLVGQMSQLQAKDERGNRHHFGRFKVTVYGRIVGGTTFDRADEEVGMKFVWMPKGFSEDRCKTLAESMKPRVDIHTNR